MQVPNLTNKAASTIKKDCIVTGRKPTKEEKAAGLLEFVCYNPSQPGSWICICDPDLMETDDHQRDLDEIRAKNLSQKFDLSVAGMPICSLRRDGVGKFNGKLTNFIEDAQHRHAAALIGDHYPRLKNGQRYTFAIVFMNMKRQEAAKLFSDLQDHDPLKSWDVFHSSVIGGKLDHVQTLEAFRKVGFETPLDEGVKNSEIRCPNFYLQVCQKHGEGILFNLLRIQKECFEGLNPTKGLLTGVVDYLRTRSIYDPVNGQCVVHAINKMVEIARMSNPRANCVSLLKEKVRNMADCRNSANVSNKDWRALMHQIVNVYGSPKGWKKAA